MTATDTQNSSVDAPFSEELRRATMSAHRAAERSTFIHALMKGRLDRGAVAALACQHHAVYTALEQAAEDHRDDPQAGRFVFDELVRVPALESDLAQLLGEDWRAHLEPCRATEAYTGRILAASAEAPERFVAHHYTRLMGDLSGGQMIRGVLERSYGLGEAELGFYRFDAIDDVASFKDAYRRRLDATPWDAGQRAAIVEESNRAFELNRAIFDELGGRWS